MKKRKGKKKENIYFERAKFHFEEKNVLFLKYYEWAVFSGVRE